jgi:hypothetical protein
LQWQDDQKRALLCDFGHTRNASGKRRNETFRGGVQDEDPGAVALPSALGNNRRVTFSEHYLALVLLG